MDAALVSQMLLAAVFGTVLYTIIGIAPGTDETAVLAPVTLALVLFGMKPVVVLAFLLQQSLQKNLLIQYLLQLLGFQVELCLHRW